MKGKTEFTKNVVKSGCWETGIEGSTYSVRIHYAFSTHSPRIQYAFTTHSVRIHYAFSTHSYRRERGGLGRDRGEME
ncbi:MAG: hypothetical protein AB9882_13750 [Ignavibacteriaceae bacterium]